MNIINNSDIPEQSRKNGFDGQQLSIEAIVQDLQDIKSELAPLRLHYPPRAAAASASQSIYENIEKKPPVEDIVISEDEPADAFEKADSMPEIGCLKEVETPEELQTEVEALVEESEMIDEAVAEENLEKLLAQQEKEEDQMQKVPVDEQENITAGRQPDTAEMYENYEEPLTVDPERVGIGANAAEESSRLPVEENSVDMEAYGTFEQVNMEQVSPAASSETLLNDDTLGLSSFLNSQKETASSAVDAASYIEVAPLPSAAPEDYGAFEEVDMNQLPAEKEAETLTDAPVSMESAGPEALTADDDEDMLLAEETAAAENPVYEPTGADMTDGEAAAEPEDYGAFEEVDMSRLPAEEEDETLTDTPESAGSEALTADDDEDMLLAEETAAAENPVYEPNGAGITDGEEEAGMNPLPAEEEDETLTDVPVSAESAGPEVLTAGDGEETPSAENLIVNDSADAASSEEGTFSEPEKSLPVPDIEEKAVDEEVSEPAFSSGSAEPENHGAANADEENDGPIKRLSDTISEPLSAGEAENLADIDLSSLAPPNKERYADVDIDIPQESYDASIDSRAGRSALLTPSDKFHQKVNYENVESIDLTSQINDLTPEQTHHHVIASELNALPDLEQLEAALAKPIKESSEHSHDDLSSVLNVNITDNKHPVGESSLNEPEAVTEEELPVADEAAGRQAPEEGEADVSLEQLLGEAASQVVSPQLDDELPVTEEETALLTSEAEAPAAESLPEITVDELPATENRVDLPEAATEEELPVADEAAGRQAPEEEEAGVSLEQLLGEAASQVVSPQLDDELPVTEEETALLTSEAEAPVAESLPEITVDELPATENRVDLPEAATEEELPVADEAAGRQAPEEEEAGVSLEQLLGEAASQVVSPQLDDELPVTEEEHSNTPEPFTEIADKADWGNSFTGVFPVSSDDENNKEAFKPFVRPEEDELRKDMKLLLSFFDDFLADLPEEKVEYFAKSEYFSIYEKLFKELGIKK